MGAGGSKTGNRVKWQRGRRLSLLSILRPPGLTVLPIYRTYGFYHFCALLFTPPPHSYLLFEPPGLPFRHLNGGAVLPLARCCVLPFFTISTCSLYIAWCPVSPFGIHQSGSHIGSRYHVMCWPVRLRYLQTMSKMDGVVRILRPR